MSEQYPREISLEQFLDGRHERLHEIDVDIARPIFEVVAELDTDSPVQAVSCYAYFEEWAEQGDGTQNARASILYTDTDTDFESFYFRDGFWRAPAGDERISIRVESELIPAIGGYVLWPNRQLLDDFTDRIGNYDDEPAVCEARKLATGAGTNNWCSRFPAGGEHDCRIRSS